MNDNKLFANKPAIIYDKEENSISFDQFVNEIDTSYEGLVLDKIRKDPIGNSDRKCNMVQYIFL